MSVDIEPSELGFRRPFTQEVAEILRIKNPNSHPVAFKVKTTAPKQYCVRPNSGRIEPGKAVEVTVLLQAMKQEPPLDAKCRDKFLVQSVAVTADKEFSNIAAIWQHVDQAEKSTVQEKKIRVAFLPSSNGVSNNLTTPQRATNGVHETPETAPPAYSSPSGTFAPEPASIKTEQPPVSIKSEPSSDSKSTNDSPFIASNPHAATSALDNSPTPADSSAIDDLKAQLAEAKAQLKSLGNEAGLRMRNAPGKATDNDESANTGAAVRPIVQQGISVQITAVLCLISFLLAYLLF